MFCVSSITVWLKSKSNYFYKERCVWKLKNVLCSTTEFLELDHKQRCFSQDQGWGIPSARMLALMSCKCERCCRVFKSDNGAINAAPSLVVDPAASWMRAEKTLQPTAIKVSIVRAISTASETTRLRLYYIKVCTLPKLQPRYTICLSVIILMALTLVHPLLPLYQRLDFGSGVLILFKCFTKKIKF